MPNNIAPSKQWTLRLKNGKRTVLLFADPAQTLLSLKQSLLDALENAPAPTTDPLALPPSLKKQPSASATPPLPASAADIEIAKPVNVNDLSQGWELLADNDDDKGEEDELAAGGKSRAKARGKGKAAVTRANGDGDMKSLSIWGIKENHVLAWRTRGGDGARAKEEDEDEEDETMGLEQNRGSGDDAGWNVVVPSYDDTYADEDTALPEPK